MFYYSGQVHAQRYNVGKNLFSVVINNMWCTLNVVQPVVSRLLSPQLSFSQLWVLLVLLSRYNHVDDNDG